METNVAGVKEGLGFAADQDAGGAEGMAGVVKFQGGGRLAGTNFGVEVPFNLAVVAEALELRLHVLQFRVGVKGILADAVFLALAEHDIDGIVQDAAQQVIA